MKKISKSISSLLFVMLFSQPSVAAVFNKVNSLYIDTQGQSDHWDSKTGSWRLCFDPNKANEQKSVNVADKTKITVAKVPFTFAGMNSKGAPETGEVQEFKITIQKPGTPATTFEISPLLAHERTDKFEGDIPASARMKIAGFNLQLLYSTTSADCTAR